MTVLCILAIYMAAFTSVVLFEFLVAAYDVVSGWMQNLKWKRRCAGRKKK